MVIDRAQPERQPLPRADLRQRRVGVGPVAVFGASNFPLAFSVAGGDTAAALAAGCPVVCKGHPAHPGTSALVAQVIAEAVHACALPEGVFSLVQGPANELGAALVTDPRIKAVGFTGSRAGGLALVRLAQARPEPVPVYAEMSSVNPVILFPAALAARGDALARGYVASLTMGAGQFCTNPGIVLALAGRDLDRFVEVAAAALAEAQPQVMLTGGIHAAYTKGVEALAGHAAVTELALGAEGTGCNRGRAALFATDAAAFLYVEEQHEVAISQQAMMVSMVTEGVFARLPKLRVVVVEAGFAWVPSMAWRLDATWSKMRDEVPHLTRPPSEYIRENLWFTTQPVDEPERPEDLRAILDWIGWDRILFATDYPHWDMDNPDSALRIRLSRDEKRMIYADNAKAVYGLP